MSRWALVVPLLAVGLLAVAMGWPGGQVLAWLCALALMAAVLAAVHHAEVVAHRVGEPFGTLVLAVAVTVIEVALIVSVMLAGGADKAALPRDTIFAAVMIICNGVVGLCLVVGGLRHHEQSFRIEGANVEPGGADRAGDAVAGAAVVHHQLARARPTRRRNWPSRRWPRWCCGPSSCSCRPCATATTSCPAGRRRTKSVHAAPPSAAQAWASFGLLLVSPGGRGRPGQGAVAVDRVGARQRRARPRR